MSEQEILAGTPEIAIRVSGAEVKIGIEYTFTGTEADWDGQAASLWLLEFWEEARALARLNQRFGLQFGATAPAVPAPAAPPIQEIDVSQTLPALNATPTVEVPVPEEFHDEEESRERQLVGLNQYRIAKQREVQEERDSILLYIAECRGGEASRGDIGRQFPHMKEPTLWTRLAALRQEGLLRFTGSQGSHKGFWAVTAQGRDRAECLQRRDEPEAADEEVASLGALRAAREQTRGKTVLLIGGEPREGQRLALVRALEVKELRWVGLERDQSPRSVLRAVSRDDVDLVILTRWHGEESGAFVRLAAELEKPVIRLHSGLNPNAVATAIQSQLAA